MPELDLSWPSPELAQESAAILAEQDLPTSSDRTHDEDGTSPSPTDGDDR